MTKDKVEELKEKGAFSNPYVMQMDKFADSLVHLSRTFFITIWLYSPSLVI